MIQEQVKYSVIIPVYNRPQEVNEVLKSLTLQSYKNFEVILVEDGSSDRSDTVADAFREVLSIQYLFKPNTGPGPSRNFGFEHAKGEYFVVFDSDCILPPHYFEAVETYLNKNPVDAWGGPDKGHADFTYLQQAMGITMASLFTTGGIRGGKKHMGWFQPRSFNMGISRKVYITTQGFTFDRLAEDIELSIRIKEAGFKSALIPDAYVFHKRRATLREFYHQVFNFGRGRILVGRKHPHQVKLTHWFPSLFIVGIVLLPFVLLISVPVFKAAVGVLILYLGLIFLDGFNTSKNLIVATLCIPSAIVQLAGYGLGFLTESIKPYT